MSWINYDWIVMFSWIGLPPTYLWFCCAFIMCWLAVKLCGYLTYIFISFYVKCQHHVRFMYDVYYVHGMQEHDDNINVFKKRMGAHWVYDGSEWKMGAGDRRSEEVYVIGFQITRPTATLIRTMCYQMSSRPKQNFK
jgi:hypothetical protein